MKELKYIMMLLACLLMTGCMDGSYDEIEPAEAPYGNNTIKETNVLTIAQLKNTFKTQLATDYRDGVSYATVTKDMQIKGYVTANDITGNIYNEVWIQDETGAISLSISQGGICGYLPVGAEILIDLKGLSVGNYRKQPVIGTPYTTVLTSGNNAGKEVTYVSRMNRMEWMSHFKITGGKKIIEPEVFAEGSAKTTWNLDTDAGKLGTLKNVSFKNGSYYDSSKGQSVTVKYNDKAVYANDFNTSWYFWEQPTTVMLYNSPFCDFAARTLPQGKVNLTGILKRYDNNWEIILRSLDDVQEVR
ncbi:MAG: hypothetical protein IKH99_01720 [Prevotella sp.]|nr:hypothetical protein [Prevotella sp.]